MTTAFTRTKGKDKKKKKMGTPKATIKHAEKNTSLG